MIRVFGRPVPARRSETVEDVEDVEIKVLRHSEGIPRAVTNPAASGGRTVEPVIEEDL
ncbi:hypothetical protein ACSDR0_12900 [Streptosporangium sp. G11]|uniref:hypothetical protein n=1 Tax=Streptosporangium sp. G11 TaxID=3436926 RepID=UPI003EBB7A17